MSGSNVIASVLDGGAHSASRQGHFTSWKEPRPPTEQGVWSVTE
jgi:hypothetical protein